MPGIVVAKVALMLLHKHLYHFAHRPLALFARRIQIKTHSYLQNLEEHLLNCFPKDRSYPQKQLWFPNQCAQHSQPIQSNINYLPLNYVQVNRRYIKELLSLPNCNKNYGFDSKFGNKIALIAWYYKLNK